jgi:ATP-dependent RNA helicase RhlE
MSRNYSSRTPRRGTRPGVAHFAPSRGSRRKQSKTIDPARFVKAADMPAATDYKADNEFIDFAIHPLLKSNISRKGYASPSEIQDKTIALGLAGRNVVGIANTGTGKTAAFALPILNKLMRSPASRAIIIAPTRELAVQIEEQCKLLAKNSGLSGAVLIGGLPMGRQKSDLARTPRIVIGTPGRIIDHLNQTTLDLSRFDMVVLDEVDRMLDMGFIHDVRSILAKLPADHQAFFFSATISPEIENLIETFAHDPVVINVKVAETAVNVHQDVVRYGGTTEKMESLHDVLIRPEVQKTLVFGTTKYGVERLSKSLRERGFKADAIHGNKSQGQRQRALNSFKESRINVLVATDVAARGLDVRDITHVINYDVPKTYDDYVHRIGRAGRAGQPGYALTFVER